MNDEERQGQMDFILSQQARFAADMRRSREEQEERWKKADERWAQTEGGIRALLGIAELHEQEIKAHGLLISANSRQIAANSKQIALLQEAGRENEERLNAFINTVERLISERCDGGPRQG
jgi:hypothetical protein